MGTFEGSEGEAAAAWKTRRAAGRAGRWRVRSSTTIIGGAGSRGRRGGGGVGSEVLYIFLLVLPLENGDGMHRLYG